MTEAGAAVPAATSSLDVRQDLVDALQLDLIGPGAGHELARERLPIYESPSNWYLTGFLIPSDTPPELGAGADENDDDLDEVPERAGLAEESTEDRKAAKKAFFPSSIGLSFLAADTTLRITVRWEDYEVTDAVDDSGKGRRCWQRTPREEVVAVELVAGEAATLHDVPASGGLQLHVERRLVTGISTIPPGGRSVAVFLVNNRQPAASLDEAETTYAFQAEIEVWSDRPFLPRPDPRPALGDDWDEQVAALHYAGAPRYATGHNVSAQWDADDDGGCRLVRTAWIPQAKVEKTETFEPEGVDLSMDRLGELPTGGEAERALQPLLAAYREWIGERRAEPAAFAIVLRRLRHPEAGGRAGAGVSVIMRYTLRLLTLDQLARAAGLICALELERDRAPERYGEWPFEIGLWVGKAATPNVLGRKGDANSASARAKTNRYKKKPKYEPSPIPLEDCPWCGTKFEPDSFSLEPNADEPRNLRVVCANWECDFAGDRALPIVAVDEPLYRRLPCFLIATVDKFAALPWEARSGTLLGNADRFDEHGFYGAAEPGRGRPMPSPLPPPDLIVQDELHLIAGPLGSMTGLYETAIEALSLHRSNGRAARPKIVASTATARQAQDQIRALFGRSMTQVFPPPGPSRRDSFFAQVKPPTERPARLYVGIASPGRNAKVTMRRLLLPLMAAAEKAYVDAGGRANKTNPADPYMTVLAYFNSLRELGGARRIVEHDLGRPGHPASRPDGRDGTTEDERRIHPGHQPRGPRRRATRPRDHAAQCPQAAGPLPLRALPPLPRDVLPLGRGGERHAVRRPGSRPRDGRRLRGPRPPCRSGADANARRRAALRGPRHARTPPDRDLLRPAPKPTARGRRGPGGEASERTEPDRRPARLLATGGRQLSRSRDRSEIPAVRAAGWKTPPAGDAGHGVRVRASPEVPREPVAARRRISGEPLHPGSCRRRIPLMARSRSSSTPTGSVRRSQVITTYGPGALVDLPSDSAIVGGLDYWPRTHHLEAIDEPRLAARLRGLAGGKPPGLFAPPAASDRPGANSPGITSPRFPEWFLVQGDGDRSSPSGRRSRTRRLVHRTALDDKRKFDKKAVVATRFVRGCPRGHVDDIDWYDFVHGGKSGCRGELQLDEQGTGGDLSNLFVRCSCGKRRGMHEAKEIENRPLGHCTGARPWLGRHANEDCGEPSRLLIRTATNAWFPQVVTVLSLPEQRAAVDQAVADVWDTLQVVKTVDNLALLKGIPKVMAALHGFDDADVLSAVERRRGGALEDQPVKYAELDALLAVPEGYGDDVPVDPDFHARRLPALVWQRESGFFKVQIEAVVQVHRLREVSALAGFTRFEAATPDIDGEYETDVVRAEIASEPSWFPAVENRGEGIFLLLSGAAVSSWRQRHEVKDRCAALESGHQRWGEGRRTNADKRPFPGGPYVLLHTLSHLLIQSLALRCGYPAASIRERIYVDGAAKRYGLLLYTASADAEGTLGGLVQQARGISDHLRQALHIGALCSNDPVCAQHVPHSSTEKRWLHGAACHGCTLVAETSCEMRNDYLDRALVVPIIGENAGFFDRVD